MTLCSAALTPLLGSTECFPLWWSKLFTLTKQGFPTARLGLILNLWDERFYLGTCAKHFHRQTCLKLCRALDYGALGALQLFDRCGVYWRALVKMSE